jgi:uncharacterized protein involved in exopolysaccharide biosynthesis
MSSSILPRDHLDGLVKILRRTARFWWVALILLVVGAGATAFALRFYHPRFQSEAVVYYQEGIQWNFGGGEPSTRRVGQRLKDTLLSRSRLAKVIEELGLYPSYVKTGRMAQAVEETRSATTFKISEGDIFTIGYTGDTAEEAQQVAAKLTDMMIEENMRLR